jgi:hypothetical protein
MQTAMIAAFAVPAAAVVGIAGYGLLVASSMQDASTSLTTVYGNVDTAKEKFQWLADFAASTPFAFPELLDATVKLKGYGIEAEDYMGTIGDAASAMGKTLDQTTEAVADAMTGEFERLKEYGIKAIVITASNAAQLGANLSDVGKTALSYVSKSGEEQIKVVDRTNKTMVLSAIQSIWDVEKGFAGAMETRSKTMSGMWSTIKDNFTMSLVDMIGFKDGEVQAASLMGVLMSLEGVVVILSGAFSGMSEPMQTFVLVSALGMAGALALASGLMVASAAGITTEAVMAALAIAVNTVIWPATLVVGSIALMAAGLVYLDEKTGIVSAAWQGLKDVMTITWDKIKTVVSGMVSWISDASTKIVGYLMGLIPQELIDKINAFGEWISSYLGQSFEELNIQAEGVRAKNVEVGDSFSEIDNKTLQNVNGQVTSLDDMLNAVTGSADTTTASINALDSSSTSGLTGQVQATDAALQSANTTGQQLGATITADGQISMGGTTGQLQLVNSSGAATNTTMANLGTVMGADGNISFAGTQGQLVLTDSKGQQLKLTNQQCLDIAKSYNAQKLTGIQLEISATIAKWHAASQAASDAMTVGHAANVAAKTVSKSYGTSSGSLGVTSPNGVKVLAAGSKTQSTSTSNTTNIGTVNVNKPVASNRGTLKIIAKS